MHGLPNTSDLLDVSRIVSGKLRLDVQSVELAEDRRKALDAGYMMHIPKPVEPAELVAVIASLTRFAVRR